MGAVAVVRLLSCGRNSLGLPIAKQLNRFSAKEEKKRRRSVDVRYQEYGNIVVETPYTDFCVLERQRRFRT